MTQTRWQLAIITVAMSLLFMPVSCAFGQETRASLGGKVTDPSGAVIQNAVVSVTAEATGVVQRALTNKEGNWRIQNLVPGLYDFNVTAPGFKVESYTGIDLQTSDQKTMDSKLTMGSAVESISVKATVPLIDTTSAVSGTVLTSTEMEELPSLTNAPTMFIGLLPGAAVANVTGGLWSLTGFSESSMNGTGSTTGVTWAMNYTFDGGNDLRLSGGLTYEPAQDTIGEMRVATNAYDASIGRNEGTTVILTSKTGSRDLHGDVYYQNQNDFLNANTYSNDANHKPITPVHNNQYGGTVGGPVWLPELYDGRSKDLFFYFGWSGIDDRIPAQQGYTSVPDAAERNGDFSSSYTVSSNVTYPVVVYNPYSVQQNASGTYIRTAYPGDTLTSVNPIAKTIMGLIGEPNSAPLLASSNDANNYYYNLPQIENFDAESLRLDKAWNNANHSYASAARNYWKGSEPGEYGTSTYNGVDYSMYEINPPDIRTNRLITFDHTLTLTRNIVLDFKYNLSNYWEKMYSSTAGDDPTALGFSANYKSELQALGLPWMGGIGAMSIGTHYDSEENNVNHTIKVSVMQTKGNHTLHYGGDYMIQQLAQASPGEAGGSETFSATWTKELPVGTNPVGAGSSIADFLLGLPASGSITTVPFPMWSQRYGAFYVQDDWRVNPKLTLNVGLRWDYERPVTERFNRMNISVDPNYVLQDISNAAQKNYETLLSGSSASNTGLALLQTWRNNPSGFIAKGGIIYAGLNGASHYAFNPRYKYFQPRLGFAYSIDSKTVIRGGLGRFVQAEFNTGGEVGWSQTTNMVTTTNNYESAPTLSFADPYPNGLVTPTGNSLGELTNAGSAGSYTDPNIGRWYTDTASIGIQRQVKDYLIDTSFIFSRQGDQYMSVEFNDTSNAVWHAAFDPQFTSTGAPVLTLAGNTLVSNPFYHVPGIQTSLSAYTSSTIAAYQLMRPNPIQGNIAETRGIGHTTYYALQNKVERRYHNGFSLLSSFTWSKLFDANSFWPNQVENVKVKHSLDASDIKFMYSVAPVYELPIGQNKQFFSHVNHLTNEFIGRWELAGQYYFQSGTPVTLPTNSSFFKGGDPALHGGKKNSSHWFDTSSFYPWPNSSTTVALLSTYPDWTGVQNLPGYSWVPTPTVSGYSGINNGVFNDFTTKTTYNKTVFGSIRIPYATNVILGARKKFALGDKAHLELGFDTFNTFNHPCFSGPDTTPGDTYFGYLEGAPKSKWTQTNSPRQVQLTGRIIF